MILMKIYVGMMNDNPVGVSFNLEAIMNSMRNSVYAMCAIQKEITMGDNHWILENTGRFIHLLAREFEFPDDGIIQAVESRGYTVTPKLDNRT